MSEQEFEVESIQDYGYKEGILVYLVKWVGSSEMTWEPYTNLENCPEIVKSYWDKMNLPLPPMIDPAVSKKQITEGAMDQTSKKLLSGFSTFIKIPSQLPRHSFLIGRSQDYGPEDLKAQYEIEKITKSGDELFVHVRDDKQNIQKMSFQTAVMLFPDALRGYLVKHTK